MIEIVEPDGASAVFDLFDTGEYGDRKPADGIYSNLLTFQKDGEHTLRVIARSETFERSKASYFQVMVPDTPPAPVEPAPAPAREPPPPPPPPLPVVGGAAVVVVVVGGVADTTI